MTWPFITGPFCQPMRWQAPFMKTALESGRVVLCAPTGAGKTAASLAPFLAGRSVHRADRCIYALPMRALARSLYEEYAPHLAAAGVKSTTLQMGGANNDPDFRGDVIFTTVDQLLSRYLMAPYGGRPGNISAGALVGAHLILDEFHLYPDDEAKLTAIAMLEHLKAVTSSVVMTATLSEAARTALAKIVDGTTVTVTAGQMAQSGDRDLPLRAWEWIEQPLTAEAALGAWRSAGQPDRVLVCINTVARAQRFYQALRKQQPDLDAVLVHARFLPSDRDRHEVRARSWLGRETRTRPSWVVATQVIEVGMDLSVGLLLSEVAPASSLVQRAGRCARWRLGEEVGPAAGKVVVFRDPQAKNFLPYDAAAVEATWRLREEVRAADGTDYERRLVEGVHAATDLEFMNLAGSRIPARQGAVEDSIAREGDPSSRWQLIRNVSSQAVIVRNDPKTIILAEMPETVSVAAPSLGRVLGSGGLGSAHIPVLDDTADTGDWKRPESVQAGLSADLLVLSTDAASYDPLIGLMLGEPGAETPLVYRRALTGSKKAFSYKKDTYEEHVGRCVLQARQFLDQAHAGVTRLASALQTTSDQLRAAALLATALHDTGKLTVGWQSWAQEFQLVIHGDTVRLPIAHTDWDPADPGQRVRRQAVRAGKPHHAVEGAILAREIVAGWVDGEWPGASQTAKLVERCVLGAIARHHSQRASEARPAQLDERGPRCVHHALHCAGQDGGASKVLQQAINRADARLESADLPSPHHLGGINETLLYWLMVRVVRLADQHSFDPLPPRKIEEAAA